MPNYANNHYDNIIIILSSAALQHGSAQHEIVYRKTARKVECKFRAEVDVGLGRAPHIVPSCYQIYGISIYGFICNTSDHYNDITLYQISKQIVLAYAIELEYCYVETADYWQVYVNTVTLSLESTMLIWWEL